MFVLNAASNELGANSIESMLYPDGPVPSIGLNDSDALRAHLEMAISRVAQNERLLFGWHDVIEPHKGAGP